MIHEIILADGASLTEHTGRIVCDLADSKPGSLSLGLALLNEKLVDDLSLRTPRGGWVLKVRSSAEAREIRLRRYGKQRLELTLGRIELERWLVFFLKYFRDSCAEVDHLDLDAAWDDGGTCEFTLKVSAFESPVSEDEARARLGMKKR